MTIGIAASGPRAGFAVIEALSAVERIASGAIGGFVSFAAMDQSGTIHRAETQTGGTGSLRLDPIRKALDRARIAVVMSSGPNRPAPLSQFTPGIAGIGLVTGHRLPNVPGCDGSPLNVAVLDAMRAGSTVEMAVRTMLVQNPTADAGIIAVSMTGEIASGNSLYLERFFDAGAATIRSAFDPEIKATVLHNAIEPHRGLALVAAQFAVNAMDPPDRADTFVPLSAGTPLIEGKRNEIRISNGQVQVAVENARYLSGSWHVGLGPRVPIVEDGMDVAVGVYEPYLTFEDGRLRSIDGEHALNIPIRTIRKTVPPRPA